MIAKAIGGTNVSIGPVLVEPDEVEPVALLETRA